MTNDKNTNTTMPFRGVSMAHVLDAYFKQSAADAARRAKQEETEENAIYRDSDMTIDMTRILAPRP